MVLQEVETSTIWLLVNLLGGAHNESMHAHVISLGLCELVLSKLRAPRSGLVKENTLWLAMNTCSAKRFRDALVDGGIIELLVKVDMMSFTQDLIFILFTFHRDTTLQSRLRCITLPCA